MLDRLINEFREIYLSLLQGNGTNDDRNRLVDLMLIIESFGGMEHLMLTMDDVFTNTQKLQYQLVKNRVQLNAHVFVTSVDNFTFIVDTTRCIFHRDSNIYGGIIAINRNLVDVLVSNKGVTVKHRGKDTNHVLYCCNKDAYFSHENFSSSQISEKQVHKGSKEYLSIYKVFNSLGAINHKMHQVIFGMVHGYISLLASGSTNVFVLNHKDENVKNNNINNLEIVTQSKNVRHSIELTEKKVNKFYQNLVNELGLSVAM